MNALQKAKLDMYKAVAAHCAENFHLISAIPALLTTFNLLTGLISAIENTTKHHSQSLTGITIAKRKSGRALARLAATLAAKIYAYADATGDDDLKERVRFPYRILARLKDNELPAACNIILDAANENLAALAAYNVTEATLTIITTAIQSHKALQINPRNAKVNRNNYSSELTEFYKSTDSLFGNQMDGIMEEYRYSEAAFFNRYVSNRIIIDPPTTSTQVKGDVIDKLTGKRVSGAKIIIEESGHTTNSTLKGTYVMKKLQPGRYTVTITKPGYKPQTVSDVLVKLGQITRVSFELVAE